MATNGYGGRVLRIGAGASYAGDRIEPATELAKHGRLDYLVYETLVGKGPASSSIPHKSLREVLAIYSCLIPRGVIRHQVIMTQVA
jgi:hypothetical protein